MKYSELKLASIPLAIFISFFAFLFTLSPPKVAALVYDPACYLTFAGANKYEKVNCPITNSTSAAEYAGKCWVASTNGQAQSSFKEFDCSTGIPLGAADSGGGAGGSGGDSFTNPLTNTNNKGQCGKGDSTIKTGIDLGCVGEDFKGGTLNPIVDMGFALFRFLSTGVGLIVIGSIIVAGIQYSASRGNPQATQAAIGRVTNSLTALLIYVFIFSIANYLVPGGMFL